MKKILGLLTIFLFAFTLVGCGSRVSVVNPANVTQRMEAGETFVLIGGATTCPHCQAYAPTVEEYANAHRDLPIVKVNIDQISDQVERSQFINKFMITGTPTTILIRDGQVVGSRAGNISMTELSNFIDENLN